MALLYRFGVPALTAWLLGRWGIDLTAYYDLLMSFYVLLAPAMVGMVAGFLLLDERDDRTLLAMMVTPVSPVSFLAYRVSLPMVVGTFVTVPGFFLAGLTPVPLSSVLAVAVLASFSGPVTALFLAAFAENKVTGFALVKVMNVVNLAPVAAYFLPERWQPLAGVVPSFWAMKATWQVVADQPPTMWLAGGVIVNAVAVWLLARRFTRVAAH
jgi:fluoroquinolone transport system permease protein